MKKGCLYQPPMSGEENFVLSTISTSFMNHKHMEIEILYCLEGSVTVSLKDSEYTLHEGELLFIGPMENHSVDSHEKNLLFVMEMGEDFLGKNFSFFKENDFTERKYTPDGEIKNILNRLHGQVHRQFDGIANKWKTRALLLELASCLPDFLKERIARPIKIEKKSKTEKNMDRLFLYIHNNLQSRITLSTAEEIAGYEKKYICRIFKEYTEMSLHKYINAYRTDHACNLIDQGKSLAEVREAVGIPDERTFIRVFTSYKKMTPTQYKNRHGNTL